MKTSEAQLLHDRTPVSHASNEVEAVVDYLSDDTESIPNKTTGKITLPLGALANRGYGSDPTFTERDLEQWLRDLDEEDAEDAELRLDGDWDDSETEPAKEVAPYPHELRLNAEAQERKRALDDELGQLLEHLRSPEVQANGYYAEGGQASVIKEMRSLRLQELPKIYADVRYESPDYLREHDLQCTGFSCQFASAASGMRALGEKVTERELIDEAGANSTPFPEHVKKLVRERGYEARDLSSLTEALDALTAGSKVVFHLGEPDLPGVHHAILGSGVRIDHGKIDIIVNDSSMGGWAVPEPLDYTVKFINPGSYSKLATPYAISRPQAASMKTK